MIRSLGFGFKYFNLIFYFKIDLSMSTFFKIYNSTLKLAKIFKLLIHYAKGTL